MAGLDVINMIIMTIYGVTCLQWIIVIVLTRITEHYVL